MKCERSGGSWQYGDGDWPWLVVAMAAEAVDERAVYRLVKVATAGSVKGDA
ncbi:MAG: hypothetical protein MUF23_07745 [Pirellula sp.]|nr:hypothetical protein [Pirellula sp.]